MITSKTWVAVLFAALALPCTAGSGQPADPTQAVEIRGAGATFPAKVYQQWVEAFVASTGVPLTYAAVGSSTGRKRIAVGEVDFGASDVPMSDADLEKHQLFQFPTLVGGVVPVVNLPGVAPGALKLSNEVLVDIFAGRLNDWNALAIRALNPDLSLPSLPIRRVVRKDGSGTTEVFLGFLHAVGGAVAQTITGEGGHANWPGLTWPVEGSGKQSAAVKAMPGAIGYISSDYVTKDGLSGVQMRNRSGEWVKPTLGSFRAAIVAGGLFKDSLEPRSLVGVEGVGVWPIVTATYILVPRKPASLERAGRTLNFFYRSFLLGDRAVAGSGFAPLPINTQARIVALLSGFQTASGERVPVIDGSPADGAVGPPPQ